MRRKNIYKSKKKQLNKNFYIDLFKFDHYIKYNILLYKKKYKT